MSEKPASPESSFKGKHLGWLRNNKVEIGVLGAGTLLGTLGKGLLTAIGIANPFGVAIVAAAAVATAVKLYRMGGSKK
ncbi:MAG: hypothetical protein V4519_00190 [Patescibacteria group bacterium]